MVLYFLYQNWGFYVILAGTGKKFYNLSFVVPFDSDKKTHDTANYKMNHLHCLSRFQGKWILQAFQAHI